MPYTPTPEDIEADRKLTEWQERRREADRRVIVARVAEERREAARRCADAYAERAE
jgi:hypothetical protein